MSLVNTRRWGGSAGAGLVTSDLLAEYRFGEGSGDTLTDWSPNGNHGTLGVGGGYKPEWVPAGLRFGPSGQTKLVTLPSAMAQHVRTMQLFLSVASEGGSVVQCPVSSDAGLGIFLRERDMLFGAWGDAATPYAVGSRSMRGNLCLTLTFGNPNRVYLNGVEAPGYLAQRTDTGWSGAASQFRLGNGVRNYYGDFYHALFYSSALSAGQVANNVEVVAARLALRGVTLGNTTPTTRDQVLFDGDSLTAGQGATHVYPSQCMASRSGLYAWTNLGIGGQLAASIRSAGPGRADVLWGDYTGARKVYVLWAGTNDLVFRSGADIYADIVARCIAAKAAGATHVIVLTVKDCGTWNASQVTQQGTLNGLLRADSPTLQTGVVYSGATYCDYLVDVQSRTQLQNTNDSTYFSDSPGVHLTDAGYAIPAADVGDALTLIGIT
ncbi:SGNH/GDSL hydrolase family protein [Gemmata sp. JC673]|uniref:SGNH/GDSL hydrolase family protein n=1 Tax=Gemmata algarum TaxID=2975278 RepID=A0ABU5ESI3_9BACT|nr:SGNH/GDSL hydrolase family protein [Gemmata algarum]MDY3558110.1 SGNH/GDSL hydrolase family protein [Gemmata algarum]